MSCGVNDAANYSFFSVVGGGCGIALNPVLVLSSQMVDPIAPGKFWKAKRKRFLEASCQP